MSRLKDFWHRFSVANGSGVGLIMNKCHPYEDDLHVLNTELVRYMVSEGNADDAFFLCNLAEEYAYTIDNMPSFEITSYMQMVWNCLKSELHLPYDFKGNKDFDRMFKAFVGASVLFHGRVVLKRRGWKRFV